MAEKSAPNKPENDNAVELQIPGARGKVEVLGVRGIFYRVQQGGVTLRKRKGRWAIALRNGQEGSLNSSGWLPGFQSLWLGNDRIYRFGGDVPLVAKILCFLPILLIALHPLVGGVLAIILVFYSILAVKQPVFPPKIKIGLPIVNTIAGVLVTILIVAGTQAK